MKKYCLTDCFKRKMSTFWKKVFAAIVIIAVVMAGLGVVLSIGYIIGYIFQYFGYFLKKGTFDVGMSIIVLALIGGTVTWWTYKGLSIIGKSIYKIGVERYEGTYKCSIFEECKEE